MTASVAAAVAHDEPAESRVSLAGDASADEPVEPTTTTTAGAETTTPTEPSAPTEPAATARRQAKTAVSTTTPLPNTVKPGCPTTPPPYSPEGLGVHALPAAGGPGRLIIPSGQAEPQLLSYSPDGRLLAYTRAAPSGPTMHIANADGSGERSIDHQTPAPYNVAWAPSGASLAYMSQVERAQEWAVYLYDIATGAVTEVFRHPGAGMFRWSRDGSRIAYYVNHDIGPGVFVVDVGAPGTPATKVSDDRAWDLSWSPDGARLAVGTPGGPAFVFDRDGTNRRQVHHRGLRVAWSPVDASKLAVDERGSTVLVDLDAGTSRYVDSVTLYDWLPDGSRLMAVSLSGVHLVGLDGCRHTLVLHRDGNVALRTWSPDGKTILVSQIA
jgi:WD40 repeat protein